MGAVNYYLELFAAIIVLALLLGNTIEDRYSRDVTKYYQRLLLSNLAMLLSRAFFDLLVSRFPATSVLFGAIYTLSFYSVLYYFACYFLTHLKHYVPVSDRIRKSVLCLCGAFAAAWIIWGLVRGMFSERTQIILYWISQLGSLYIYVLVLMLLLRNRKTLSRRAFYGFLSFPLLPMISTIFLVLWPSGCFMELAITTAVVLVHTFVRTGLILKLQEQELQLARARIHIAARQIQPHFLYNTLNSIYALCELDPSAAQTAVADFSEYLRVILENLENDELIPVRQEISHIRHYLDLEKMRYQAALRVEYELEETDFSVPPLSLQPFVENAVNHGLMPKPEGGTVWIRTWVEGENAFVEIRDDGVGFDMAETEAHIGIENASQRLRILSSAEVSIQSKAGAGTTVTVRVPREGRTQNGRTLGEE